MQKKLFIVFVIMAASTIGLLAEEGFRLLATIRGESPGNAFSEACSLGDINQDGYDDYAVGAWEGTNGCNIRRILEIRRLEKQKIKTILDWIKDATLWLWK